MFSLVKFDNDEYEVIPSNKVKVIQGTDCLVKYKNGAKYHAYLLDTAGIILFADHVIIIK